MQVFTLGRKPAYLEETQVAWGEHAYRVEEEIEPWRSVANMLTTNMPSSQLSNHMIC